MRIPHLVVISLALLAPASGNAADPTEAGFAPLFNGKNLDGWVNVNCAPGTFFVKNGEIITTGKPTGFMRSAKQYENFILEIEWLHVNKTEIGNSGIFIWGDPLPVTGSPFARGIEVQVLVNLEYKDKKTGAVTASSHGDVFSIQGATCKPDRPHPTGGMRCIPSEFRAHGGGAWNRYRITANHGTIKLEVNGKEVAGVSECKPHRKGYLALESEGAECHFRNIRIKELPSTNPKTEEIAPLAQDIANLYTGVDLSGWKSDTPDQWKLRDWTLTAAAAPSSGQVLLASKEYGDCELMFDCRLTAAKDMKAPTFLFVSQRSNGKTAANVRIDSQGKLAIHHGPVPAVNELLLERMQPALKPAGQWNRVVLRMKGKKLSVAINGKTVAEELETAVAGRGSLGLAVANGAVDFANIYVREMK